MYNFLGLYHWDDIVTEFQPQLDVALVALFRKIEKEKKRYEKCEM